MNTQFLSRKAKSILARQEKLNVLIPGALCCKYISLVNQDLPNGYTVKSVSLNPSRGVSYEIIAYNNEGKHIILKSTKHIIIDGVVVDYVTLD